MTTADLTGATAPATSAPEGRTRRATLREQWAWAGLIPFFAFLFLFLLLPTYGVINGALHDVKGHFTWKALSDSVRQEKRAFYLSLKLSFLTAFLGAVIGTVLAYAAATAKRPKWLRNLVTAFSGVAANMGGVVLAFLFISLLGAQGLGTKVLKAGGWDLYAGKFNLNGFAGWATVYMYFQIPLMILVTLPAVDGLKESWREASSNLGGTTFTYWRRVGLPVLLPSMLGGFMLLFANSFSAFATAAVLNAGANLVPVRISFYLQGDISGKSPIPYALAAWMIMFMAVSMSGYLLLRRRAERWRS